MELTEISVLFINTQWRGESHKWTLNDDGLVAYNGLLVQPDYVVDNFNKDYPMFTTCGIEICKRIINNSSEKPFKWVSIKKYK